MGERKEDKYNLKLCLYYNYFGNYTWFKTEILKDRFDVLKYLQSTENKEKYNVVIELYRNLDDREAFYL